ncbi:MAG: hypothetical protein AB7T49_06315 [Oligoflexales bacterium]
MSSGSVGCPKIPKDFFSVPDEVYRGDHAWLREDRAKVEYLFSAQNQYFEKGHAWLATDAGARLAGFYHPDNLIEGKKVAYFGFWETTDSIEPNRRLFNELKAWAEKWQVSEIYGPINFSTFMDYRIRIAPFCDYKPFIGEPYNPTYYQVLLESLGYALDQTYFTQEMIPLETFYATAGNKQDSVTAAEKEGFKIQNLTKDYFLENMDDIYVVIDDIFSQNFAYRSISLNDFKNILGMSFAKRICPVTSFVATRGNEIAALYMTFPNYADLAREKNVRASDLNYTDHFKMLSSPELLIKTSGVRPKFRSYGLHTAITVKCIEALKKTNAYKSVLGCLIRQGNKSGNFSKHFANNRYYGLFKLTL